MRRVELWSKLFYCSQITKKWQLSTVTTVWSNKGSEMYFSQRAVTCFLDNVHFLRLCSSVTEHTLVHTYMQQAVVLSHMQPLTSLLCLMWSWFVSVEMTKKKDVCWRFRWRSCCATGDFWDRGDGEGGRSERAERRSVNSDLLNSSLTNREGSGAQWCGGKE